MNTIILILGTTLATFLCGCTATAPGGGSGVGSGSQAVVLDQRCAANTDCPSGFQCETEQSHGPEASYCVSDDSEGTSNGQCPAGYELESEHGETLCKAHGGGNDSGAGGSDDSGSGGNDSSTGGDDSGAGGSDDSGGGAAPEGASCVTSADCAPGLECETEIENGVSTSSCKVHG